MLFIEEWYNEIRKMSIDGVSYNVLTDNELNDFVKKIEFKK